MFNGDYNVLYTAKDIGLATDAAIERIINDMWQSHDKPSAATIATVTEHLQSALPPIHVKWLELAKRAAEAYQEFYGCETCATATSDEPIGGSLFIQGDVKTVYTMSITRGRSYHNSTDGRALYHIDNAGSAFAMLAMTAHWLLDSNGEISQKNRHTHAEAFKYMLNACDLNHVLTDEDVANVVADGFSNHVDVHEKVADYVRVGMRSN